MPNVRQRIQLFRNLASKERCVFVMHATIASTHPGKYCFILSMPLIAVNVFYYKRQQHRKEILTRCIIEQFP